MKNEWEWEKENRFFFLLVIEILRDWARVKNRQQYAMTLSESCIIS